LLIPLRSPYVTHSTLEGIQTGHQCEHWALSLEVELGDLFL